MKNLTGLMLALLMLGTPLTVYAHGGAAHELSSAAAETRGKEELGRLADEKVIAASWKTSATMEQFEIKPVEGKNRWSMVFSNADEKESDRSRIALLLTPMGKYVSHEFVSNS